MRCRDGFAAQGNAASGAPTISDATGPGNAPAPSPPARRRGFGLLAAALLVALPPASAEAQSVPDTTPPTVSSAAITEHRLVITFNEPLAPAAHLVNSAFTVKKTPGRGREETAPLSSMRPVIAGRTVTLRLHAVAAHSDHGIKVSYRKPGSGPGNVLRDATGNEVADFTDQPVTNNSNTAPTVAHAIPDQVAFPGREFRYTVPANTFHDADHDRLFRVDYDRLTYAATQGDGTALPAWLTFDPATRRFTGTPQAADAGRLAVRVIARDFSRSAEATFTIRVAQTDVCLRTPQVRDAIVAEVPGVSDCAALTHSHLRGLSGYLEITDDSTLTTLHAGDFAGLTNLRVLDLTGNRLTTLPADLFDPLTTLTQVHLINNRLTALPAGLFDQLTGLTVLSLNGNRLTTLPAGLFDQLPQLLSVGVATNRLTTLPAGLFDPHTRLVGLNLSKNGLTTLPAGLFDQLTALAAMDLQVNTGAPFQPTAHAGPDRGSPLPPRSPWRARRPAPGAAT